MQQAKLDLPVSRKVDTRTLARICRGPVTALSLVFGVATASCGGSQAPSGTAHPCAPAAPVAAPVAAAPVAPAAVPATAPVLPSWTDGAARSSIVDFVTKVTTEGGADYVPPTERIAVFDNDGTLWSEQPMYVQLAFTLDRIKALAPEHPEWKWKQPFKAALQGDMKTLGAAGTKGLLELIVATHSGTSPTEFGAIVHQWLSTAKHPKYGRPYTQLVFAPMVELLEYLRANAFKTFIVSGGGIEFMRPWSEATYGIPPEQVIGSRLETTWEEKKDGAPGLVRQPEMEFVDDGPGKPVGIDVFIGRRPIFAAGNSDGDLQMLQYADAGSGASLQLLVHHTDAVRESAYDRESAMGRLDKALDAAQAAGWTVVDMKQDWKRVFAFDSAGPSQEAPAAQTAPAPATVTPAARAPATRAAPAVGQGAPVVGTAAASDPRLTE